MSCYKIFYDKETKCKMMQVVKDREEYLQLRDSSAQKAMVRQVRNEGPSSQPSPVKGEGVDTTAKRKAKLLQMNYSCIPSDNMKLKGCTTPSNSVGMDVDLHRDDFATEEDYQKALVEIPEKVLAKKDELGLLMLERSATKGYHLVFKRKAELSQEDNLRWASDLLGVEFDKGAKDITRVFITTTASEEDLLYLDDGLFTTVAIEIEANTNPTNDTNEVVEAKKDSVDSDNSCSTKEMSLDYDGVPYVNIIEALENQLGGVPAHGSRNQFIFSEEAEEIVLKG